LSQIPSRQSLFPQRQQPAIPGGNLPQQIITDVNLTASPKELLAQINDFTPETMSQVQDMLGTALHTNDPAQSSFAQLITGLHQMQLDFAQAEAQGL
jgi:hypothetical protein